jgi:hypothetical protein
MLRGMNTDPAMIWPPGTVCRTRDRRAARIHRCVAGLLEGEVEMHGPCVWLADGRWRGSPFGATGPLDLLPPTSAEAPPGTPRRASLKAALARGEGRFFCCD